MKCGLERNGVPERLLWFEWLPVSGQACFLSFPMSQQKQLMFHPFIIPERFLSTAGVRALGSEDCVFMQLRIPQADQAELPPHLGRKTILL